MPSSEQPGRAVEPFPSNPVPDKHAVENSPVADLKEAVHNKLVEISTKKDNAEDAIKQAATAENTEHISASEKSAGPELLHGDLDGTHIHKDSDRAMIDRPYESMSFSSTSSEASGPTAFDAAANDLGTKSSTFNQLPSLHHVAEEHTVPLLPHERLETTLPRRKSIDSTIDTIAEDEEPEDEDPLTSSSGDTTDTATTPESLSEGDDELKSGPQLPHEGHPSTADDDEISRVPTLSYEDEFPNDFDSQLKESRSLSSLVQDYTGGLEYENHPYQRELEQTPILARDHFNLNKDDASDDASDAPLLPHERGSTELDSGSILASSSSDSGSAPEFRHESSLTHFVWGNKRALSSLSFSMANRTTLPHVIPRTDDDDADLLDPHLEQFPTKRNEILQRVSTIKASLPEDEIHDLGVGSPTLTVQSQACSTGEFDPVGSYELRPIKSTASLNAVMEEDSSTNKNATYLLGPLLDGASPATTSAEDGRNQSQSKFIAAHVIDSLATPTTMLDPKKARRHGLVEPTTPKDQKRHGVFIPQGSPAADVVPRSATSSLVASTRAPSSVGGGGGSGRWSRFLKYVFGRGT
jgi:hypothetical protein